MSVFLMFLVIVETVLDVPIDREVDHALHTESRWTIPDELFPWLLPWGVPRLDRFLLY